MAEFKKGNMAPLHIGCFFAIISLVAFYIYKMIEIARGTSTFVDLNRWDKTICICTPILIIIMSTILFVAIQSPVEAELPRIELPRLKPRVNGWMQQTEN